MMCCGTLFPANAAFFKTGTVYAFKIMLFISFFTAYGTDTVIPIMTRSGCFAQFTDFNTVFADVFFKLMIFILYCTAYRALAAIERVMFLCFTTAGTNVFAIFFLPSPDMVFSLAACAFAPR